MAPKKESREPSRFLRLSGLGFQMGITIFLGAYLGKFLDAKYPMEKKWWTIGLTITAVAVALYNVLRQLNRINAEDEKD